MTAPAPLRLSWKCRWPSNAVGPSAPSLAALLAALALAALPASFASAQDVEGPASEPAEPGAGDTAASPDPVEEGSVDEGSVEEGSVEEDRAEDPAEEEAAAVDVTSPVSEEALQELGDEDGILAARLRSILAAIDNFEGIEVEVDHGVARLSGEARSSDDHDQVVALVSGVEGVIFVDDEVTEPVAVGDRIAPLKERFEAWVAGAIEKLPLFGIALLAFFLCVLIGRFVSRRDALYGAIVKPVMLRDLARRATVIASFCLGLLIALEILDATALVGTILGAAGVFGLAVGFAFRDIVENYLASFLLAARRPFSLGDSVEIGDHAGKVVKLTMRETVLMTFDGNHLSLPNASVFKAAVLNYSRNPRRRFDFVVGAGVDADLVAAQRLGVETLRDTPGTIEEPSPYCVIEQLGDSNVALRFYAWLDQTEVDFQKVRSEGIRRVKIALEDAGVDMPEPIYRVHMRSGEEVSNAPAPRGSRPVERGDVDVSVDRAIDEQIEQEHADEENLLEGAT